MDVQIEIYGYEKKPRTMEEIKIAQKQFKQST